MPRVSTLLIDTPLLPRARVTRREVRPELPPGADPRRLGRTDRLHAALQLLAAVSILEEFDLWPMRAAIRQARAVTRPGGVRIVLGGWPVPLSTVHARLGGGEGALRTTRDAALRAIATRTGLPPAMLASSEGIDWLTYQPAIRRVLESVKRPLPRATARSLWAQRLELPRLPEAGEVRYWDVADEQVANRLGVATSSFFQDVGGSVVFLDIRADRDGLRVRLEDETAGMMVVVGSPRASDLLALERLVERGAVERAVVFGSFPLGWSPPAPVMAGPAHRESSLIIAGLPPSRARGEAARWCRRASPLTGTDRRALTTAAAHLFEPETDSPSELDEIDGQVLEIVRLDPSGIPGEVALGLSGLTGELFARRAQALGAVMAGGRWRLTTPLPMTPGRLHGALAATLPEGSPLRHLHEALGGIGSERLETWCRQELDDLRAGSVRALLSETAPEGLPLRVVEVWVEACLADLDLDQARRLIAVLPDAAAAPWETWLHAVDRPPERRVNDLMPGGPLRAAAEVALRLLEAAGHEPSPRRQRWLDVLGEAGRELSGALGRRFSIEKKLAEEPRLVENRQWRQSVAGGHPGIGTVLMRRAAVILMRTGDGARARRIFERLASRESNPGPAGLIQLDLGWLALDRGDWRMADAHLFRAYRLLQAAGFLHKTKDVLFNLAVSDLDHLNLVRARERFEAAASPDDPVRLVEQVRMELARGDEAGFRRALESVALPDGMTNPGLDAGLSFLRGVEALLSRRDDRAAMLLDRGGQEAEAWLDLLDALGGRNGHEDAPDDDWGVRRCARLVRNVWTNRDALNVGLLGEPTVQSGFAAALCERLQGRQGWIPGRWRREAAGVLEESGLDGWAQLLRRSESAPDAFVRVLRRLLEEGRLDRLSHEEVGDLMEGAGISGLEVRSRFDGRIVTRVGEGQPGPELTNGGLMLVPLGGDPGEHDGWALLSALVPLVTEVPLAGSSGDAVASGLYGENAAIKGLRDDIRKLAPTRLPVAFFGETGVGKDVAAQALHRLSGRRGRFVAVNMAALPPQLVEAELFGSVRGAFTGADRSRRGLVLAADGGTLFLDEIGDLDLALQAKLLRFLESGEVRAVGADRAVSVDVRIVTATHRDLEKRLRDGRFRPDLYYRISSASVRIPPLRERREDIPVLRALFEAQAMNRDGLPPVRWSRAANDMLFQYGWPGNVRELRHTVDVAMVQALGGTVMPEHLPFDVTASGGAQPGGGSYEEAMRAFRRRFLENALTRHGGNRSATARELGISRQTLLYHIRTLGLTV